MSADRGSAGSPPAASVEQAGRRLTRIAILLLVVLVVVACLPLRHGEYIQDDHLAVEDNPIVERGRLAEIFSTSYWAGARGDDRTLYRPVTLLSFAWERAVTGEPRAPVSRWINVMLHLAATLSLLWLMRRVGADPFAACVAALIFGVHPVHVEAIAGAVGRAEILAALFSLLGLALLSLSGPWRAVDGIRHPAPAVARLAAWGAAAALFLALGAKEIALATPALYVALELLFRPRTGSARSFWIGRAGALAPSALAALLYLGLRVRALEAFFALQQAHPMDNPLIALAGVERTATALGLVARTLRLLLYPIGLSADYSGPVIRVETGLFASLPLIGSLVLLGCAALALRPAFLRGRRDESASLAALGALLFLLPYLVIGNLLFGVGTIFAERLLYFPSVGFCFLCGMLLRAVALSRQRPAGSTVESASPSRYPARLVLVALGAWLAAFTVLTWARVLDWRDDESLFRAACVVRPESPRAHYIVGKLLADRGEFAQALERYERTTDLYPAHVSAWNEKGVVRGRMEQFVEAERMLREAVRISPIHSDAHLNLGIALRRQRRLAEAEDSLRRALLWDAASSTAWAELGNLYLSTRRYGAAEEAYRRGVALGRRDLAQRMLEAREAGRRAGDLDE